jgi:hypothetical protein
MKGSQAMTTDEGTPLSDVELGNEIERASDELRALLGIAAERLGDESVSSSLDEDDVRAVVTRLAGTDPAPWLDDEQNYPLQW